MILPQCFCYWMLFWNRLGRG